MYCPQCGKELIKIGYGKLSSSETSKFKKAIENYSDSFSEAVREKAFGTLTVEYYVCLECKVLYFCYKHYGVHFEIIGEVTDKLVAALIGEELKRE